MPERGSELVILVHGCNSSTAKFTTLADVFESRGVTAGCFRYDDRDSLESVAKELRVALLDSERGFQKKKVTLIGHSQGGLVARRALAEDGLVRAPAIDELVTISTPFGGIRSARHCGLPWLQVASFGITVGICQFITGRKWTEIHEYAPFIVTPPVLGARVAKHLVLQTDETQACRERTQDGRCSEGDLIFSVDEQSTRYIDDARLERKVLIAGHTEVVGEDGVIPEKLLKSLEEDGLLPKASGMASAQLGALYSRPEHGVAARAARGTTPSAL